MTVSSYIVSVVGKPAWGMMVNAKSAGQAKSEYHRHLLDAWPDVPFTALRCHKNGAPHTSDGFTRNAQYRGLPNIKCGDRVKVGEATGVIVGHNDSANFEVLFDDNSPKYAGARLSVHPSELTMV